MSLTIDLSPQEEEWLATQAALRGLGPKDFVKQLIDTQMPKNVRQQSSTTEDKMITAKNAAAIAMLQFWMEEDATDDPEELRQEEAELEELKRNLNANRAATGERLVFPE